ncbi:MAG: 16S rRNA (uracil(1498)-N(3))-methyltransferase [Clostridia bacterium]|nr:16S rRNA (uracil(1498)-N(3))-methyltransferase [Clostridia bacterium]
MHRFYALAQEEDCAVLSPEDAHHALHVLRLHSGDPVEIVLGGKRYTAAIASATPDHVTARLTGTLPDTESTLRVTLFQGLPKGDKMELIVQKAVELGCAQIVPVAMSRCVVKLTAKDAAKKCERWQKIAREAGKQSGRTCEVTVTAPVPLATLSEHLSSLDAVLVPWEEEKSTGLRSFCLAHPQLHSLGIIIGPEGGISPEEIDILKRAGALPVTLGPRILRTETAGICALSAVMCLMGEMESGRERMEETL